MQCTTVQGLSIVAHPQAHHRGNHVLDRLYTSVYIAGNRRTSSCGVCGVMLAKHTKSVHKESSRRAAPSKRTTLLHVPSLHVSCERRLTSIRSNLGPLRPKQDQKSLLPSAYTPHLSQLVVEAPRATTHRGEHISPALQHHSSRPELRVSNPKGHQILSTCGPAGGGRRGGQR